MGPSIDLTSIDLTNQFPQRQLAVSVAAYQQPPASWHAASNNEGGGLSSQMAFQAAPQHVSSEMRAEKRQMASFADHAAQSATSQQTQSSLHVEPIIDRRPVSTKQVMQATTPAAEGQRFSQPQHAQAQHAPIGLSRPADARLVSQPAADSDARIQGHASSSAQPVQTNPVAHQPTKAERSNSNASGVSQQSQATSAKLASLTQQIKQMKTKMIQYASLLDSPEWKQQQPDQGKAVSHSRSRLHFVCEICPAISHTDINSHRKQLF